jgi:hypothetical protein
VHDGVSAAVEGRICSLYFFNILNRVAMRVARFFLVYKLLGATDYRKNLIKSLETPIV